MRTVTIVLAIIVLWVDEHWTLEVIGVLDELATGLLLKGDHGRFENSSSIGRRVNVIYIHRVGIQVLSSFPIQLYDDVFVRNGVGSSLRGDLCLLRRLGSVLRVGRNLTV